MEQTNDTNTILRTNKRGPKNPRNHELTHQINNLRVRRSYWMKKLQEEDIDESRKNYCNEQIDRLCNEIAKLTNENVENVYREFRLGKRGRPCKHVN